MPTLYKLSKFSCVFSKSWRTTASHWSLIAVEIPRGTHGHLQEQEVPYSQVLLNSWQVYSWVHRAHLKSRWQSRCARLWHYWGTGERCQLCCCQGEMGKNGAQVSSAVQTQCRNRAECVWELQNSSGTLSCAELTAAGGTWGSLLCCNSVAFKLLVFTSSINCTKTRTRLLISLRKRWHGDFGVL